MAKELSSPGTRGVRGVSPSKGHMSQGTFELTGGDAFELTRLNRALVDLARPTLSEAPAQVAPPRRKELIEHLWSRKRRLLREAGTIGGWGPESPIA
jgi:hypothetical protein